MSWSKPYTLDFGPTGDNVKQGVDKLEDNVDDIYTDLNKLKTCFIGTSAPTNPDTGQLWADSSTTPATLKIYDGANWTTQFSDVKSGFISGVNMKFNDVDAVDIAGFSMDINGVMYSLDTGVTLSVTSLSNDTWYYIFAEAPASGLILTSGELSYDTTAPTYVDSKGGWYDSTGDLRCIGAFYSNGSGEVTRFTQLRGRYLLIDPITMLSTTSPATAWTAISANAPEFGELQVYLFGKAQSNLSSHQSAGYLRSSGQTDTTDYMISGLGSGNSAGEVTYFPVFSVGSIARPIGTNSDGEIDYYLTAGYSLTSFTYRLAGFELPGGF